MFKRLCCRFLKNTVNAGPPGLCCMFLAFGGCILVLIGGLMFAVHKPHLLVESKAELFSVQNDFFDPTATLQPETYSWCLYSISGLCEESDARVNTTARRDDTAYNGMDKVPPERCLKDAEIVDHPDGIKEIPAKCLDKETGLILCPRPWIRAWQRGEGCSVWTLNDPEESNARFTIISTVGAVSGGVGLCVMFALCICCEDSSDVYDY
eukprot:gnl/MRDRNA2_/MRDRNA2_188637_c0_seq1.p1 gnl/MRDRNA2_/MRDRNA2_188637_c0~~gnl/MRDRNA2_/MRDRNA2_188637_c0_seq1.p1  ORF type:complete len:209 (+),score=27.11 gnl/MRDRNA2_/MRDRNA2_188637_c0_seq1:81-707(+)